jgi:hypothetical protein
MKRLTGLLFAHAALSLVARGPEVRAGEIFNATIAGAILNNTIPDNDFYVLTLFAGVSTEDVLSSMSTDTTTGFSQTLSGAYAGPALSVAYTGDSTAFPAGSITWASTGSYGAQAWAGSGSATFTFPTPTTFQVAYSSSLAIGSNTVSMSTTISGADDGISLIYTDTTGTITINGGIAAPIIIRNSTGMPVHPIPGDLELDDIEVNGKRYIKSTFPILDVNPNPPAPPEMIVASGTLGVVPEPPSSVLAGFGVAGVLVGCARRGRSGERKRVVADPAVSGWRAFRATDRPCSGPRCSPLAGRGASSGSSHNVGGEAAIMVRDNRGAPVSRGVHIPTGEIPL